MKTIQEILEDLNDLFRDGLDGTEAFQILKSQASSLGYRIRQQGNKIVAVKA